MLNADLMVSQNDAHEVQMLLLIAVLYPVSQHLDLLLKVVGISDLIQIL